MVIAAEGWEGISRMAWPFSSHRPTFTPYPPCLPSHRPNPEKPMMFYVQLGAEEISASGGCVQGHRLHSAVIQAVGGGQCRLCVPAPAQTQC